MKFCNNCADENQWPKTFGKVFSRCESCGEQDFCNSTIKNMIKRKDDPEVDADVRKLLKRIDELEKGMLHLCNTANKFIYDNTNLMIAGILKTAIHKYEKLAKDNKVQNS